MVDTVVNTTLKITFLYLVRGVMEVQYLTKAFVARMKNGKDAATVGKPNVETQVLETIYIQFS